MGGRLVVVTLLMGGTALFAASPPAGYDSFTPLYLTTLIGVTYGLSALYGVWILRTHNLRGPAVAQLAWDLALTTGLLFVTGGASSVLSFLYGVNVLMAALILGPAASNAAAVAALILYTTLGVGLANGWVPPPPDQPRSHYFLEASELGTSLLSNVVGLTLVAVLSRNLSERLRRTGGQLRRAERSVASLARLNDDIVRSLTSGLLTTDLHGRVRTINPAGASLFAAPEDSLVGLSLSDLFEWDSDRPSGPDDARSRPANRGETTAYRPDGSQFPVGFNITDLVDVQGAVIGRLLVFQDLSEIRALRQQAERAQRLAALGRLAAGLAHEIRNPLSSISGSVQLVRDSAELQDEDRRLLGIVTSEAERLEELVTTMLQVGRPSEPDRTPTDLGALVAEVLEMARRGPAQGSRVELHYTPPSEPVTASLDPGQVRQVVWNLLKNAIQASAPSHGETVTVEVCDDPEHGPTVVVYDCGPGLAEGHDEQLFEMFYSGRKHGIGLGLALVKQIVQAHGGTVHAENRAEARGARFEVRFGSPPVAADG
jgi:two-component system sensor histidine kinase PilS (NtrC family)